jgi:thiol peroxidase
MSRLGFMIAGSEFDVEGPMLAPGQRAPDFALVANSFRTKRLADFTGKVKIISVVPSLDTSVCAAQTRRFNQEASSLSDQVVVLTVSADLPYAQARWCAAEGIERVETLSDHKTMAFSTAYGVNVVKLRITQRAVFVVDQQDRVRHAEYVANIDHEPNYAAVLEAALAVL